MWRFLADENFNADIVRGLKLRNSELDIVTVREAGLTGADDPHVLEWAAKHHRTLLTHDRATMPNFAYVRVDATMDMVTVFVVNDRLPVGTAINEIHLIASLCAPEEFGNSVVYLPL